MILIIIISSNIYEISHLPVIGVGGARALSAKPGKEVAHVKESYGNYVLPDPETLFRHTFWLPKVCQNAISGLA